MTYFTQLALLLFIGLGTVAWKINRAIAREKKSRQVAGKTIALPSWPAEQARQIARKGAAVILFIGIAIATMAAAQVNFRMNKSFGCAPLIVNFTNSTSSGGTCTWDFGTGNTSVLDTPSATFSSPGIYQVKLVVKNGNQCDSVTRIVTVFNPPVVNFFADKTTACLNDTIHFQNEVLKGDAPVNQYAWGFGNGIAGSDSNVAYKYSQTGSYNITLVVQDTNGCAANKTISNYVHVFPSPNAAFSASPANSCSATQLVNFTNASIGSGLSYSWQLDDSATSTQANPVHTYHQEKHTVTLLVTDNNGCKASASEVVSALDLVANFHASPTTVCTGQGVAFRNTSNFPGTGWLWNFGDGTISYSGSPTISYSTPGIYSVSFKIGDGACKDSIEKVDYIHVTSGFSVGQASFTADSTISCGHPLPVQFTNTTTGGSTYHWIFGNGDTSNAQNPNILYNAPGNYTVTLTVTDSAGCSITGKVTNMIHTGRPVANFKADTLACPGSPVQFTNSSVSAQSFYWNFGDGDTSSAVSPVHHYQRDGIYTVTLTAFNSGGCDTTITKMNYIHINSIRVGFQLQGTFSPCPPFACTMTNQSQSGLSFAWIFGDGYTDTATNPTHIYFYPGVYTVKLVGYSATGCIDTVTRQDLVTVQGPTGTFTVEPKTGCAPLLTRFSANTSSNTNHAWWDMGDGTVVQDSLSVSHTYARVRVYQPQLILEDHVGCTVAYPADSVVVHGAPVIQNIDTSVCPGTSLAISLNSVNSYSWSPAKFLSCATCNMVEVNPNDSVIYYVTGTNSFGCQATAKVEINVVPLPVLSVGQPVHLCKGDSLQLFAGNAANITWSPSLFLNDANIAKPVCSPSSSITYTVSAFNSPGCVASASVPVIVNDKIDVTVPQQFKICGGGEIQLSSTLNFGPDAGVTYSWSPAQYLDNPNSANPVANTDGQSQNFQLVASGGHCVADTQNVQVLVNPLPVMEVVPPVTTTPYANVTLSATSNDQLSYGWSATDPLSCETCGSTTIAPAGSQTVYVTGTDQNGCTVKDSVSIVVEGTELNSIFVPNGFSPNGDGHNDVFQIYGHLHAIKSMDIAIFNRWGEELFESHEPDFTWDGTYKGVKQSPGVYTYQMEMSLSDGEKKVRSGSINLLR